MNDAHRQAIDSTFPRLNYAFSDVVCYVIANARTIDYAISSLVEFGKLAVSHTEQTRRPAAVIIFNQQKCELESIDPGRMDQGSFFNYFSSIECISLPYAEMNTPASGAKVLVGVEKLYHTLAVSGRSEEPRWNEETFIFLFRAARGLLKNDPMATLDIATLTRTKRPPIIQVTESALAFFHLMRDRLAHMGRRESFRLALAATTKRVGQLGAISVARESMVRGLVKYQDLTTLEHQRLPPGLKALKLLLHKAEKEISRQVPCNAVDGRGFECVLHRISHQNNGDGMHKADGSFPWNGPYQKPEGIPKLVDEEGKESTADKKQSTKLSFQMMSNTAFTFSILCATTCTLHPQCSLLPLIALRSI
jgi:hypothetical protein